MAFSPLDSELTGPLVTTVQMRSIWSDRAYIAAQLKVEAALARAEAKHGLVSQALASAIGRLTADDFDVAALGASTAEAGVSAIPFVAALEAKLPEELRRDVHRGATSQDLVDTARVLQGRDALDLIAADLAAIVTALSRLATAHRGTPCVGRTYGQHAAPVSFGYVVAVWLAGIAQVARELPNIRSKALMASLDGPVGTRFELGENAEAIVQDFAADLGLVAPAIAWHTRRLTVAMTGWWLASMVGALAKMATDVMLLSMTEIGEVAEPHKAGRGGSSAMPHKRNPVSSTVILAAHAAAPQLAAILTSSMAAAGQRPAGAWHAESYALPTLFGIAAGALSAGKQIADGLIVDVERMRTNLDLTAGLTASGAVTDALSAKMPREAARAIVENAAATVRQTGRQLKEVLEQSSDVPPPLVARVAAAFDIAPAVAAAAAATDRAVAEAAAVGAVPVARTTR